MTSSRIISQVKLTVLLFRSICSSDEERSLELSRRFMILVSVNNIFSLFWGFLDAIRILLVVCLGMSPVILSNLLNQPSGLLDTFSVFDLSGVCSISALCLLAGFLVVFLQPLCGINSSMRRM